MPRKYRAYEFALQPTPSQWEALESDAGAARVAYNWALDEIRQQLNDWHALGTPMNVTAYGLRKLFNLMKDTICMDGNGVVWWTENSKEAYSYGISAAAEAFRLFIDSKLGRRKGRRVGFPNYKSRKLERTHRFAVTTGITGCVKDAHHIKVPRIPRPIRVMESIYKRLKPGTPVKRLNLKRRDGRWYAVLLVEVPARTKRNPSRKHVGIDEGVEKYAALSNGIIIPGLKPIERVLDQLAHEQRALSRCEPGSVRWRKHMRRYYHAHAHASGMRRDQADQFTKMIATQYGEVSIETLRPSNMVRNHNLARSVEDQGLGMTDRMLEYKCEDNGTRLTKADMWYPSSQLCSHCGHRQPMPLNKRVYRCDGCGARIDRDVNAARNLDLYGRGFAVRVNGAWTLVRRTR